MKVRDVLSKIFYDSTVSLIIEEKNIRIEDKALSLSNNLSSGEVDLQGYEYINFISTKLDKVKDGYQTKIIISLSNKEKGEE